VGERGAARKFHADARLFKLSFEVPLGLTRVRARRKRFGGDCDAVQLIKRSNERIPEGSLTSDKNQLIEICLPERHTM
jgi:hypothetical protein